MSFGSIFEHEITITWLPLIASQLEGVEVQLLHTSVITKIYGGYFKLVAS